MDEAILDTDIYSEILRAKNKAVLEAARAYRTEHRQFTLSAMSVVELFKGLKQARRDDQIQRLRSALEQVDVLPLDKDTAEIAGEIYGGLDRSGQTIGRADPIVAATAIFHGLDLVTGNTQHFERVVKLGFPLRLANWRESTA